MSTKILVVQWEWGPKSKHAGSRFWAAHGTDTDGRILDWPKEDLIPIGASEIVVTEGQGLDLLVPIAARTEATSPHPSEEALRELVVTIGNLDTMHIMDGQEQADFWDAVEQAKEVLK